MRAAVFDRHGPPADVLTIADLPDPTPGPGQVVVALEAAAVHPADLATIAGHYGVRPRLPGAVPGIEGVGRVVAVGAGAALTVGQRVLLPLGVGTWRDRVVATARTLVTVPDDLPAEQLALAVVNPATARLLLGQVDRLLPGEWILQNAANGAVGRTVARLARARGLHTLNVVRRATAGLCVRNAGGDVVLVDGPELAHEVARYTDGAPVRLALDAVAGPATDRLARCVVPGGSVVVYGALSGQPSTLGADQTIFRDVRLHGFWLTTWLQQADDATRAALFTDLVADLRDHPQPVDARFDLGAVAAAVAAAARGGRDGKVVLRGEAWNG